MHALGVVGELRAALVAVDLQVEDQVVPAVAVEVRPRGLLVRANRRAAGPRCGDVGELTAGPAAVEGGRVEVGDQHVEVAVAVEVGDEDAPAGRDDVLGVPVVVQHVTLRPRAFAVSAKR